MVQKAIFAIFVIFVAVSFTGCSGINTQRGLKENRLTVGTVQKEIKRGMSSAEVAEILGSPNIA